MANEINSGDFQNIARAVSAYTDEAYTEARKLISTELVGTDAQINVNAEDYYGTIRWYKPLGTLDYSTTQTSSNTHINIGTQTDDEGLVTEISTDFAEYIKTVRTHGASEMQVQRIISGQDGLAKIARDFGETQARDQDAALRAVMNGVATREALTGSGGQEDPDSVSTSNGFYVDLNNSDVQDFYSGTAGVLIDDAQSTIGAKVSPLLAASSLAWSDYEPDFMYLVTTPAEYLKMKAANLIDEQDRVTDGNVTFETILNGKYRLIVTRQGSRNLSSATNVESTSTKTSFLMLPGAISFTNVGVPNPVAFDRDESLGRGTGKIEAWYRWGYVLHPRGYSWNGSKTAFASNEGDGTTFYNDNGSTLASNWTSKVDQLNKGILPIFHA